MNINKKRNKTLWIVILTSFIMFGSAVLLKRFIEDEYIVSWLFAMSQALSVFAIFRFKIIKDLQEKSNIVLRTTFFILSIGIMITLLGVLLSKGTLCAYAKEISHIGSFVAGLGINGLISYMSNHFDFVEAIEDKQHKKQKRKRNKS